MYTANAFYQEKSIPEREQNDMFIYKLCGHF